MRGCHVENEGGDEVERGPDPASRGECTRVESTVARLNDIEEA